MSLLTEASLIVTPNGYNVNKLYSVIPNTTLGDMAVTRGSSATRVNEQKLIEIARTNLLLQSQTFDNASWNKNASGINTSIGTSGIESNVANAPSGTLTADRVNFIPQIDLDLGLNQLYASAVATQSFVSSIYVKGEGSNIGKQIRLRIKRSLGGSYAAVDTTITLTSDWVRITSSALTLLALNTGVQYIISSNDATNALIWGAQLEAGSSATEYIPTIASIRTKFAGITQDGLLASNIPRIDYPPLGGCPSILVEPARTNLVLYSEEFNDLSWNKSDATISANATNSPSGNLTADKLIEGTSSGQHYTNRNITNSNSLFSFSIFAKKSERNFLYLNAFATLPNNFTYVPSAYFDLNNGTVGTVSSATATIQDYGNGWYRCTLNCTSIFPQTSTTVGMYIMPTTSNGNSNYLGNGTSGIFIWGAQAEIGTTVTSYIPTTTATVPRVDDVIRNLSATTLIGQTEGTLFVDVIGTKDRNASPKYVLHIYGSKGIQIIFFGNVIDVSSGLIDIYTPYTSGVNYKVAVCYSNTGNFRMYVNGFKYFEQNDYVPGTFNALGVGCTTGGASPLNSNINSAILWKTALTDDQCILLTGPSFSSYVEMANNFPNTLIYSLQ